MRDLKAQLTRYPRTPGSRKWRFRASSALSPGGTAVQHDQLSNPLSRSSLSQRRAWRPPWTPTWTLATALYAQTDDLLKCCPERAPWRPAVGITPQLSDAELLTLAVSRRYWGSSARPAGCTMPANPCTACSSACPASPDTTNGCANWPPRWLANPHACPRHQPMGR